MEDEKFNLVIEEIRKRVGQPVKLVEWEYFLNRVEKETAKTARLYVTFSHRRFTFNTELKLFSEHYQDIEQYDIEINRRLNILDEYYITVEKLKNVAASNIDKPLPNEGAWKAFLLSVNDESPVETIVEFVFSKELEDGSIQSFTKTFNLILDTFVSYDKYAEELNSILDKLNTPVEITTDYYTSLIPNITY